MQNHISQISSYLKRFYRIYSSRLLASLQDRGYTDLRISFLEVLNFLCENEGSSIKEIGTSCGLKKQTMTSHLNELEKRGYIIRQVNAKDKREQHVFLTDYGKKFRLNLLESIQEIENDYQESIGDVELNRLKLILKTSISKIS